MQIFIKTFDNTLLLEVSSNTSVMNVKEKIWATKGIPIKQQILHFSGIELNDKKCLGEYNICDISILILSLRLKGGMLICVRSTISMFHGGSGDGRKLVLDVESTDTIRSIKETILMCEGVPIRTQIISFGGKIMENSRTLEECTIHENSTLVLFTMPSG
jgi:Ubiquitin family